MQTQSGVDHIRRLWLLNLIFETGSLKKAALRARVSPSAVSQSLSALERSLGQPLVIRNRGQAVPTQAGRDLIRTVGPALRVLDRVVEPRSCAVPPMSWLTFGALDCLASDVLPGLHASLKRQLPACKVTLTVGSSEHLTQLVRNGELCMALVAENAHAKRLRITPVATERLAFYASARHAIGKLGWRAAREYGVGVPAPAKSGHPTYYARLLTNLSETFKPTLVSSSYDALRSVAVQGTLVAILPERVAKRIPGELIEIEPPRRSDRRAGGYELWLVSERGCDPVEDEFLARELKSFV